MFVALLFVEPFARTIGEREFVTFGDEQGHDFWGSLGDKVYVELTLTNMTLSFGGGKIRVVSSVSWGEPNPEKKRLQVLEHGTYENWKNNETRKLLDSKKGGYAYYNAADCPIDTVLQVAFFVYDYTGAGTIGQIAQLVTGAILKAVVKLPVVPGIIQGVLNRVLNSYIPLGSIGFDLNFPSPCPLEHGGSRTSEGCVPLTNMVPLEEWPKELGSYPATVGQLWFKVRVGKLNIDDNSNYGMTIDPPNNDTLSYVQLERIDFGQCDEATVTTTIALRGDIPSDPLVMPGDWLTYKVFYDVDNRTSTGGSSGAEYILGLSYENPTPIAKLLEWKNGTYEEVANGCYDYEVDADGKYVFLTVELERLGNPVGPIASWATVSGFINGTSFFDILPDNAPTEATFVVPSYSFSQLEPQILQTEPVDGWYDVNRSAEIRVELNKAMNRSSIPLAFSMNPPANGVFTWQGNAFTFTPSTELLPFTNYSVTVNTSAVDRASMQLNFTCEFYFFTESLPLFTCTQNGAEKREFMKEDPVYVTGREFSPNSTIDVYIIHHVPLSEGDILIPINNVTSVATDSNGTIPPTLVWYAPPIVDDAEFNVVADVNRDGRFQYATDRVDRLGNGFIIVKHDVAALDILLVTTTATRGDIVQVNVTITNHGNFNETFNTILYYNNLTTPSPAEWNTFWSLGDVNRDGYIDDIDLAIIAANQGWSGPAGQNSADVNMDGQVNVLDLFRCSSNMGRDAWTQFGLFPRPISRQNVTLTNKDTTTLIFSWNTTGLPAGNYTVSAYVWPLLDETHTTDNGFLSWIMIVNFSGDMNGDSVVDIYDAIILANAFNSVPSSPNWNPNADLKKDGTIDIYDALILSGHFNQHYP